MTTNSLSAVPAWVNSLADTTIRADMVTATGDGTISYSELLKVLTDLSTSVSLGTSGLTAGQFSDLKAITTNWKTGVSMSSYLEDVLSRMVNGDLSNATFTGGGTATVLGNLAVGSPVTQINTLIGKWFLGTDLPSATVTYGNTFKITYAASTAPLFSTGGPSINDINQGSMGDCYLLSSLAEIALNHPSVISSMFVDNGNNTYGVRFYVNGKEDWVTVNNSIPMIGTRYAFNDAFNPVGNNWVDLIEKAFAQLNAQGNYTGNGNVTSKNSFTTIGNGGSPLSALKALTNSSLGYYLATNDAWTLNMIVSALNAKNDVVLNSWTNSYDSAGMQCLVSGHAMSITGYNAATGKLIVFNPFGTRAAQYGQKYRTTFEVSLAELEGTGDRFCVDGLSAMTPKLVTQTARQTWQEGQTVSFALPVSTFTDPGGLTMTYSATQANGQPLPSWLRFNAATGTFSGVVPAGTAGFSAIVTATDSLGLAASETIQFAVSKPPASPPILSTQTTSQTWYQGVKVAFSLPANTFTDPQGTAMTLTATLADGSALPSWLSFNGTTNSFSGTVAAGTAGLSIKVTAKDAAGLSVSETFSVSTPVAAAPKLTVQSFTYTITEGLAANFTLSANSFTDPQNLALTYTATQSNGQALPSWLTFNAATRKFTALPPANAIDVAVKVTATDTLGLSASEFFSIYTLPAGPYLAYQTANKVVVTGTSVSIKVPAGTFQDDKAMTYSAYQMKYDGDVDATSWLHFDPTSSTFSGVVAANENGTLHMKVVALDTLGRSANETFDISFKNSSGLTLASTSVPSAGQSQQTYALLSIAR